MKTTLIFPALVIAALALQRIAIERLSPAPAMPLGELRGSDRAVLVPVPNRDTHAERRASNPPSEKIAALHTQLDALQKRARDAQGGFISADAATNRGFLRPADAAESLFWAARFGSGGECREMFSLSAQGEERLAALWANLPEDSRRTLVSKEALLFWMMSYELLSRNDHFKVEEAQFKSPDLARVSVVQVSKNGNVTTRPVQFRLVGGRWRVVITDGMVEAVPHFIDFIGFN